MIPRKKSLLDRIESGELKLTPESKVKSDLGYQAGIEATIRFMEETRAAALASPRKQGRPNRNTERRETEVRSLRLEKALWAHLDAQVEVFGCSINRFIEESILERLGLIGLPSIPSSDSANEWGSTKALPGPFFRGGGMPALTYEYPHAA